MDLTHVFGIRDGALYDYPVKAGMTIACSILIMDAINSAFWASVWRPKLLLLFFILGVVLGIFSYPVWSDIRGSTWEPPFHRVYPRNETNWGTAVMIYIKRSEWRSLLPRVVFERQGVPVRLVEGIDTDVFENAADVVRRIWGVEPVPLPPNDALTRHQEGYMASYMTVLRNVYANHTEPWLLVLEDDAVPFPYFAMRLRSVVATYMNDEIDVIWLDSRNTRFVYTYGFYAGGMVATLFRTSSIPRIIDMYRYDSPQRRHARVQVVSDDNRQIDSLLARFCNWGYLRCAAVSLARECEVGMFRTQDFSS